MAKSSTVEKIKVWERGQITIPTKIRNQFGIEENTILVVKSLKDGILLQPERDIVSEVQKRISAERKKQGVTIKEMLDQLDRDE